MQPPFHRLAEFVPTPPVSELFTAWSAHRKVLRRHQNIPREGDPMTSVFFLLKGWVTSSIMTRDGRRQIVKVHLPGDMLGFPSLALEHAGESLEALTGVELCPIPLTDIGRLFETLPSLAAALFLSTPKERVALMQELTWVGSTNAIGRLAGFLLDLYERLDAAGLVEDGGFDFPLTQVHLGELRGITGTTSTESSNVSTPQSASRARGGGCGSWTLVDCAGSRPPASRDMLGLRRGIVSAGRVPGRRAPRRSTTERRSRSDFIPTLAGATRPGPPIGSDVGKKHDEGGGRDST